MSDFKTALERIKSGNLNINFSNEDDGLIVISAGKLIKNAESILSGLNVEIDYVITRYDYSLMVIKTMENK